MVLIDLIWVEQMRKDTVARQVVYSNKFTRKPIIIDSRCFLDYTKDATDEQILSPYMVSPFKNLTIHLKLGIESICLTEHAFQRWNERCGPKTTRDQLERILFILFQLNRIFFAEGGWGIIDHDILFGYVINDRRCVIETFFGRIRLKPGLINFDQLMKWSEDQLDLRVSDELLQKQWLPIIPREAHIIKGNRFTYHIEEYDKEWMIIFNQEKNSLIKVNLLNPFIPTLSRSVLKFFLFQGYIDFVVAHIAYHYPQKLQKYVEKRKKWLQSQNKKQIP